MVVADKYAAFAHQHSLGIVFLCIGQYFISTFRYKKALATLRTGFFRCRISCQFTRNTTGCLFLY